jgi:nucleotide-binding universal stress UspA family protein
MVSGTTPEAVPPSGAEGSMVRVRRILYPTDFSSFSTAAYFHAVSLAEAYRASLTIAYVFTPDQDGETVADRAYWERQLRAVQPANSKIPVQHVLLQGDPATEIVAYAEETGPDMIVMGTHGRSGTDYELMGSVAEQVLRESPCAVLVVKLPQGSAAPAARSILAAV